MWHRTLCSSGLSCILTMQAASGGRLRSCKQQAHWKGRAAMCKAERFLNFQPFWMAMLLAFHPCTPCHAGGSQHSKSFWYIENAGRRAHTQTHTHAHTHRHTHAHTHTHTFLLMKGCQLMSQTANSPSPLQQSWYCCFFFAQIAAILSCWQHSRAQLLCFVVCLVERFFQDL